MPGPSYVICVRERVTTGHLSEGTARSTFHRCTDLLRRAPLRARGKVSLVSARAVADRWRGGRRPGDAGDDVDVPEENDTSYLSHSYLLVDSSLFGTNVVTVNDQKSRFIYKDVLKLISGGIYSTVF